MSSLLKQLALGLSCTLRLESFRCKYLSTYGSRVITVNTLYSTMSSLRPPSVRNMTVLDRDKFSCDVHIPVLEVKVPSVALISKLTKKYFLKLENFKPIQNSSDSENPSKVVYFNPGMISKWTDFDEDTRAKLTENCINETNFVTKKVTLTYENWSTDSIFKAVLPENQELLSGYSIIGHIVHLNLRDHLLPYKHVIGQVILDKIKICRTVVNKLDKIDNTYRNFAMEVIAGEEDFDVTVKENNITFQFDFSKVYWNPRLGKEHSRIVELLRSGDVLFDVFCGVGPFAITAAKKKCTVFANDLNPESYKWLNYNIQLNKVKNSVQSFNMDGAEFIKDIFKNYLMSVFSESTKLESKKIHITMNLPALAVEFLSAFNGLFKDYSMSNNINPDITVHVYCFTYGDTPDATAKEMVNKYLGHELSSEHIVEVFNVRNVSTNKEMMRVSFKLTKSILKGEDCESIDNSEPPLKKKCS